MSQDKFINKVQALFAKAASTEFEAEREECLRLADKLILSHQIDRALLKTGTDTRVEEGLTSTEWEIPYTEFSAQVGGLLGAVMQHCQIRMAWKNHRTMTVVGFESDIAYAEMLWAIIYREFAGNLWPKWKSERTFDANVYAHVKGGYKWRDIADVAIKHGVDFHWHPTKRDGGKLKRAYQRECERLGVPALAHTQRHSAFRASYAQSFQQTISLRLRDMRKRNQDESGVEAGQFALAVRSNAAKVQEEFYRLFPHHDPANRAAENSAAAQAEAERRAAMTQKQRDAEDARRERQYQKDLKWMQEQQNKNYDVNGWSHGNKVARNVDLSMGQGHLTPNRTELH